jgi:hypothetical protein
VHPATVRVIAAMAHGRPPGSPLTSPDEAPESDRAYYRRRSREERDAARRAAGAKARKTHEQLAGLYARLSDERAMRLERPRQRRANAFRSAAAGRAKRQDALLDEALKGTFPASDPVSVAFIHYARAPAPANCRSDRAAIET